MVVQSSFEIRRASLADADEIARVHVAATRAAYRGIYSKQYLDDLSVVERARLWAEKDKGHLALGDPFGVFAAFRDGKMIGFGDIGPAAATGQAELYAIYVDPAHIGKGAGRALMRTCFSHASQHGFRTVTAQVLSKNTLARRFYESLSGTALPESERVIETGGVQESVISYQWHIEPRR